MHPRFYAPAIAADKEVVPLPLEEAEHLVRVLRLRAGAEVCAFDGKGNEYKVRVESADRKGVLVRVVARLEAAIEPEVPVTLAQALLKGSCMDSVVRDAVMLGVAEVQPVISSRAAANAGRHDPAGAVERWHRIAVSSAKQCGRAVVPEVNAPVELRECLRKEASPDHVRLILLEPGTAEARPFDVSTLRSCRPPSAATVLVGPEGGWTVDELGAAVDAGFRPVTLGRRTLRAEATPLVIVTLLQHAWGDL
ncbi:MAG: 16S rRNA (uracil(1498)-N(3))-methyltransferase [Vicinamibacterales bacterium]